MGGRIMLEVSRRSWLTGVAAVSAGLALDATPVAAADFFAGKILHFYVGIPPGGAYDLVPRILAAHIGTYIPGNPRVVVENMPGAGSLTMMNFLYNQATRDGTSIGFPMNTMLLEPTLKLVSGTTGNAHFDLARMAWIGTPGQDPAVAWVGGNSPIKSFADLRSRGATFGSTGAGADSTVIAKLMNKLLGTKLKIVSGYKGVADYLVAFERGEIEGAVTTYAALMAARPDWIRTGRIRVLAQFGTERSKDLPDVPTAMELAPDTDARQMLQLYGTKFSAAYPVVLPPDVPPEQVRILREAFVKTMADPGYKKQIAAVRISGSMVPPQAVEALVRDLDGAPQSLIDRLRDVLQSE
jgi:tripartite-type tricarboxylate transporter receptor subunit TctC